MAILHEERLSDSPLVESIWYTQAISDGCDIVSADVSWDMIISRQAGEPQLTVWGPMTKAVHIPHAAGSDAIGIRFKLGTYLTALPTYSQLNSGTPLPEAGSRTFWLSGSSWEYPNFENVETFIQLMERDGLLGRDPLVEAALQGDPQAISLRSIQRRFLRITGLTQRYIRSIERAQQAVSLLGQGTTILDAAFEAGYADQQHMTKALKLLMGQTPAQIAGIRTSE